MDELKALIEAWKEDDALWQLVHDKLIDLGYHGVAYLHFVLNRCKPYQSMYKCCLAFPGPEFTLEGVHEPIGRDRIVWDERYGVSAI